MQKTYILLLVSIVLIATGCPRTLTKPSLKTDKNGRASVKLPTGQINQYLQGAQIRYDCFKQGKEPKDKQEQQDKNKKKSNAALLPSCPDNAEWLVKKDNNPDKEASRKMGALLAKQERDDAIEDGLAFIDGNYETFIDDLNNGRSTASFVADVIDLGTSATIGISKGERPLQILGIALTAFRGGRKSASLNFFREQSTPVLINKMDDSRSQREAVIIQQKAKPIDEYSMRQGIRDVVAYYNAGTLIRAFTELSKDTGAKALESEKKVLQLQKVDPADIVMIDDVDANLEYINLRKKYSAIFADGSKATDTDKSKASESLRLIYKDINKDTALATAITKAKTDNPSFVEDMDKLADTDVTKADEVSGRKIISIINKIYGSLNLETDGALVKKLVEHINAHPIKK